MRETSSGAAVRKRGPIVLSVIVLVVTLVALPLCTRQLGPSTSGYVSGVLAVVICLDLMSMWLLTGEYADTGDRRMLAMAVAYLWSLIFVIGYSLAFPGVLSPHPPLAVTTSVAPYLYVGWHAGFPILLGAAWLPGSFLDRVEEDRQRARTIVAAALVTSILALGLIVGCVRAIRHLPVLIHGLDTTAMTRITAPIALPLVVVSLVVCIRGVRGRAGPERWTQLAIVACTCDLLLTYTARARFSLGWYAGRTMTVAAAAVVLIGLLSSFRALKAEAEFNAAYDGLTGLQNRRSTYDALTSMIARARRAHTQLTVVMFDLDHFKRVNDTYGHAAGDTVLRAVADSMRATVRDTDIVGRVGGEEFLILLPDATGSDAELVVERLRASLRLTATRYCPDGVTASFGIAMLDEGHTTAEALAQRADQGMYEAKTAGRDRVAISTAPLSGPGSSSDRAATAA